MFLLYYLIVGQLCRLYIIICYLLLIHLYNYCFRSLRPTPFFCIIIIVFFTYLLCTFFVSCCFVSRIERNNVLYNYYYSYLIFHSRTVFTVKNQNKHPHTTTHFVSFFTISPPHPFIHHSQRPPSTVRRDFTTTAVPPLRASPRKTASTHCGLCERPRRSSSCTCHQPTRHQHATTYLSYK